MMIETCDVSNSLKGVKRRGQRDGDSNVHNESNDVRKEQTE